VNSVKLGSRLRSVDALALAGLGLKMLERRTPVRDSTTESAPLAAMQAKRLIPQLGPAGAWLVPFRPCVRRLGR